MFDKYVLIPFLAILEKFNTNYAFCIAEQFYTYNQFAQHISKIRIALRSIKLRAYHIGLVTNDDIETYASIFAIWLEGYTYVPLHSNQPKERSLEIIDQAEIKLILDSSVDTIFKSQSVIQTINLNFESYCLKPKIISDDLLAYILFTSGSTGKPKGVKITRKNVGAFMKSFWETGIEISETDRCLQCFDLTFDVSVQSYLVPLTKGACTYTIPHDQIKYSYVFGLLEDHQLTFGAMAPSMIRYLRPYFDEISVPSMRYNILTAEASPEDLVNDWSKCIPNAVIFDFYGPTEATIYCTYYRFIAGGNSKQLNGMLCIGKAMNGLAAIIVDDERNILGAYQKGELCIAGGQLTPGYWNNPEKNAESFFELNFEGALQRFYKTGDSCYFDEDGDILYAGRLDFQVKIQGFRVELGEIEFHAREFVNKLNAIAVAFTNNSGNTEIALFVEGDPPDRTSMLEYLKKKLPYYMIPTKIMTEPVFPLSANGKIDCNMLKKLII